MFLVTHPAGSAGHSVQCTFTRQASEDVRAACFHEASSRYCAACTDKASQRCCTADVLLWNRKFALISMQDS